MDAAAARYQAVENVVEGTSGDAVDAELVAPSSRDNDAVPVASDAGGEEVGGAEEEEDVDELGEVSASDHECASVAGDEARDLADGVVCEAEPGAARARKRGAAQEHDVGSLWERYAAEMVRDARAYIDCETPNASQKLRIKEEERDALLAGFLRWGQRRDRDKRGRVLTKEMESSLVKERSPDTMKTVDGRLAWTLKELMRRVKRGKDVVEDEREVIVKYDDLVGECTALGAQLEELEAEGRASAAGIGRNQERGRGPRPA